MTGWNPRWQRMTLRCRNRPGRSVEAGLAHYIGKPHTWPASDQRYRLRIQDDRLEADSCRQCDVGLARDAARDRQATEAGSLEAFHDAARALAEDHAIDDAERGRRLRFALHGPSNA